MTGDKPVLEQVHEYENLFNEILVQGMNICDVFEANCLVNKLSPSWCNYVSTNEP